VRLKHSSKGGVSPAARRTGGARGPPASTGQQPSPHLRWHRC
jgi:hypothetical protein